MHTQWKRKMVQMVKIKACTRNSCLDSGAIRSFSRVDLSRSPHVRCRVEITRQRIDVDWWHQSRDVFNTRVSIKGGEEGDVIGWRRYPCVRLRREPFCRREPYQSEIRREGWRNARPEIE